MSDKNTQEQRLFEDILRFKYDPEGFVLYAFPWGIKNTPLEKFPGPRMWQRVEFRKIKAKLKAARELAKMGVPPGVIYLAISSGRGPGKSALLAMLDMWFMSCWVGGTNIKTANTETQLRSRTMAELGKWHTMAINSHWFEKSSMSLRPAKWFAKLINEQLKIDTQYYYTDGQSWSEENPDAFAGAHSQIGMMLQYDEASGIPNPIWEVSEGFFTDLSELRLWVVISNPRRNTGKFYDCFHDDKEFWDTVYVDSRTVEGVDTKVYNRIVEKYGEDSDVTRVEVKGEFPRRGSNQLISRGDVQDAQTREVEPDNGEPLLLGIDVARFGDDSSSARFRRGRDARSMPQRKWKGLDTMELADEVAELIERYNPDATFVDGNGVGGGVVDRLRALGYRVIEVQFGESAEEEDRYLNKRSECWARMGEWLTYGAIDDNAVLAADMTAPEYEIDGKGRIVLETKASMKKRGLPSPDEGDALAMTFAVKVARRDLHTSRARNRVAQVAETEYDIFSD